jgi:nicotinamide mononucleotide transporter
MSLLEAVAFVGSIFGVWLTTTRSLWNYPFSLLSVSLYGVIFYRAKLYADAGLQGIFAVALIYGLCQWLRKRNATGDIVVTHLRKVEVAISILALLLMAATLGSLLYAHTDASLPWVDSLLFAGSLIASVWAARCNIESWQLWIIVDVIYAGLYVFKHLYVTAVLYAVFVVLAVRGLRQWQLAFDRQSKITDIDF